MFICINIHTYIFTSGGHDGSAPYPPSLNQAWSPNCIKNFHENITPNIIILFPPLNYLRTYSYWNFWRIFSHIQVKRLRESYPPPLVLHISTYFFWLYRSKNGNICISVLLVITLPLLSPPHNRPPHYISLTQFTTICIEEKSVKKRLNHNIHKKISITIHKSECIEYICIVYRRQNLWIMGFDIKDNNVFMYVRCTCKR